MELIENRTFDEINPGDAASLVRTLTYKDIELFAIMSGDINPTHLDEAFASSDMFHKIVAHGMWSGALISTVLGTQLPGPGTVYVDQSLHFQGSIGLGDTITVTVKVRDKIAPTHRVIFDCRAVNQKGEEVVSGTADVIAPTEKISRPRAVLPDVALRQKGRRYEVLLRMTQGLDPIRTAVVHPVDAPSLLGAVEAARIKLITPVLVGPESKIRAAAALAQLDLAPYEIVSTEHSEAAAVQAVAMARAGKVEALMKGALHTDELMHAVVDGECGLRTARRLSHVFAIDAPDYPRPLFITDAAINIYPTLADKRDIVQNAIDLAHALGIPVPRVAILSAVELVTEKIKSTLDAAALCKMADRGQITGGVLDGPLAFDNAVSVESAKTKGITSPVAGRADIFVVPDLEAGNMLAKQLEYLAEAQMAGIVLGARVPIILTSRSDGTLARLGSCAIALLLARHKGTKPVSDAILVLNAGSSSIKFSVFPGHERPTRRGLICEGECEGIGHRVHFTARDGRRASLVDAHLADGTTHEEALAALLDWIEGHFHDDQLVAAGHRVVHGGSLYTAPVVIDASVSAELRRLIPLAPLHQPHNLAAIDELSRLHPALPQVACFDTAFHHTQSEVATAFALPRRLTEEGIRRYGFHGLSYEYIASVLPDILAPTAADGRVVVAHLGSGASLCAIRGRKSVATTMGFTALDGLVMSRRAGNIDPGVILYLMQDKAMTAADVSHLLYSESGLLGVSGISDDMRTLLASDEPAAKEAVDLFVYRVARELGSMAAALGGIDALVFTAGIGEHAAEIRRRVCKDAAWLGVDLDQSANVGGGALISHKESRTSAWVIPTDEDLMIALHTWALLNSGAGDTSAQEGRNA